MAAAVVHGTVHGNGVWEWNPHTNEYVKWQSMTHLSGNECWILDSWARDDEKALGQRRGCDDDADRRIPPPWGG